MDEMDDDNDVIMAAALAVILCCCKLFLMNKRRRKRRCWKLSVNKTCNGMLCDLLKEPCGKFENFCRMSAEDFEYLFYNITPKIAKQDTNMRQAIAAKDRLAVTLRFLATGD